jgi:DNA polymerase-3 subunit beta
MEFRTKKDDFLKGLTKVQGITGRKTNIPITSNVLISTKGTYVSVVATDLEIAFQGSYKAEVSVEGSTAVPSRKLYEIIRDFPSDLVKVKELENKWIKIADKNVKYDIVGMVPDEFPGLPNVEGVELFEIDAGVLKGMIEKTIYAVLADEARAHLAGVFFETITEGEARKLRMVSTDGHRLSRIDQSMEKGDKFELKEGVIVPKSGVMEVLKLLEGGETVQIGFKDNNLIVIRDLERLIIRLIEGEFPDYELVIPKGKKAELIVNKDVFLMMLKRMSILSSDKYRSVRFKIDKNHIETITTNPEIGESREIISVRYSGQPMDIAFNPRYFIDAISTMRSDEVIMKLRDEATPCILEGEKDPGFLGVIMPMRI